MAAVPGLLMTVIDAEQIRSVVDRYAWIEIFEQSRYCYHLTGILKLPARSETDDLPPHRIRARLLMQAESLLMALSQDGWQLADGAIDIRFRTDVTGPLLTLAGEVAVSSKQRMTTATMTVLVMREIVL